MRSILNALEEGRLIKLPDNDKEKALRYMASVMEAIPDVNPSVNIVEGVLERERKANTALGKGWACPHIRVDGEGELFSVVGWSWEGIDYGASDGKKVHLLVMYYIPQNRKNDYLKEVSILARAIEKGSISNIEKAENINDVRNELLNWVSSYLDSMPSVKAKMIKLQAKQATTAGLKYDVSNIIPLYIVVVNGKKIALSQDIELNQTVENFSQDILEASEFETKTYKILIRSKTIYKQEKYLCDCLALKIG